MAAYITSFHILLLKFVKEIVIKISNELFSLAEISLLIGVVSKKKACIFVFEGKAYLFFVAKNIAMQCSRDDPAFGRVLRSS